MSLSNYYRGKLILFPLFRYSGPIESWTSELLGNLLTPDMLYIDGHIV